MVFSTKYGIGLDKWRTGLQVTDIKMAENVKRRKYVVHVSCLDRGTWYNTKPTYIKPTYFQNDGRWVKSTEDNLEL